MNENDVKLLILEELAGILSDAYSATGMDAEQLYKRLNESVNQRIKSIKAPSPAADEEKPAAETIQIEIQTPEDIADEIQQTVPRGVKLEKAGDETKSAYGIKNKDTALLIISFGLGVPGSTMATWLAGHLKKKAGESKLRINRLDVDINEFDMRFVIGGQMRRLQTKNQE